MKKTFMIISSLFLMSCGHMATTDVKSTENDQYSSLTPVTVKQGPEKTEATK